jgi:hypothetical protein
MVILVDEEVDEGKLVEFKLVVGSDGRKHFN